VYFDSLSHVIVNPRLAGLESTITNLRGDLEQIKEELQNTKIALRNMQEERNAHVNAVAIAIATNEDLKAANVNLHDQLEQMEQEMRQAEKRTAYQREEYKSREDRLRQHAREARQAAVTVEEAMKKADRRDDDAQEAADREAAFRLHKEDEREREEMERFMREQAKEEREEQRRLEAKWEFDRRVEDELQRIRPDLFVGGSEPIEIPSVHAPRKATVEVEGKKRVIAMPRSRRTNVFAETSEVEIAPEPKGKEKERIPQPQVGRRTPKLAEWEVVMPGPSGDAFDNTTMSITPEEVRRIAKEINAERKKRKATQAAEKAKQEEELQQELRRQREEARRAEPAQQKISPAEVPAVQTASSAESAPKKNRKVLKVVYLMDGDTTEIRNLEQEIEGLKVRDTAESSPPDIREREPVQQPVQELGQELVIEGSQSEVETSTETKPTPTAEEVAEEATTPVSGSKSASASVPRVAFQEPVEPSLPVHVHPMIDHASESHDPRECTVCVRYDDLRRREEEIARENPLKDIDHSCLFPAPELEPVSKRQNSERFEEEATLRPSVNPQTQLERVVRQLKDEFRHLKL
jgi:hypothetical protein